MCRKMVDRDPLPGCPQVSDLLIFIRNCKVVFEDMSAMRRLALASQLLVHWCHVSFFGISVRCDAVHACEQLNKACLAHVQHEICFRWLATTLQEKQTVPIMFDVKWT